MSVSVFEMRALAKDLEPILERTIEIGKRIYDMYPETKDRWLDNDAVDLQNAADSLLRKVLQITDRMYRIEQQPETGEGSRA